MSGGLLALLDDVALIARAAAASLDDISIAASKAGAKAAGVVIDDAAVTPAFVEGLTPARELPIIWKIFKGSLKNKLLFLLPGALALSTFLPEAIVFLLLIGGAYLCYEGAEKVLEKFDSHHDEEVIEDMREDLEAFEAERVSGAVRTDLVLSAEIMAISLGDISALISDFWLKAGALTLVAIGITVAVYGAVALLVKLDDIGLHLAGKKSDTVQNIGIGLIAAMPIIFAVLSYVGTLAMLWVGGGIILHSLHEMGVHGPSEFVSHLVSYFEVSNLFYSTVLQWLANALFSAIFGVILGTVLVAVHHGASALKKSSPSVESGGA